MFQSKLLILDVFSPLLRKEIITNFLRVPQEDNKKSCKNIYPCHKITLHFFIFNFSDPRSFYKHRLSSFSEGCFEKKGRILELSQVELTHLHLDILGRHKFAGGYILSTNRIVFNTNIFGMNILPLFR